MVQEENKAQGLRVPVLQGQLLRVSAWLNFTARLLGFLLGPSVCFLVKSSYCKGTAKSSQPESPHSQPTMVAIPALFTSNPPQMSVYRLWLVRIRVGQLG